MNHYSKMNYYRRDPHFGSDSEPSSEDEMVMGGASRRLTAQSGEKRTEPAQTDMRQTILSSITEELRKNVEVLAENYKSELEKCHTGNGRFPTLLHWIVSRFEWLSDEWELMAAEKMLSLALHLYPDLITKTNSLGDTALHLVVGSEHANMERLGWLMCEGDRKALSMAIANANKNGETCIHLAIKAGLEIATTLIDIADETAFSEKRKAAVEGVKGGRDDGGNTPLHDAVAYERCIFEMPKCNKISKNGRVGSCCRDKMQAAWKSMRHAEDIVRNLVRRYDKALTLKNDSDQSPYMYFLRTKRTHLATRLSRLFGMNADFDRDHATSGSTTPFDEVRPGYFRDKSHPIMRAGTSSEPYEECPTIEDTQVAEVIGNYLLESAFAVGSFEDACACFFGDHPDEEGRDAPFRPGYPIYSNAHEDYKFLIPRGVSVLCQVDLMVGTTFEDAVQQAETEDKTSSPVTKNIGWEQKQKEKALEDWKNHMQYLKSVFEMLRERGIRRILKVTVMDNPRRPCSDRVIRECLKDFDVRYLDWQKDDLSIDVVLAAAPRVAELTLYSSGSRTVLRGWAARNGLCTLNQMTRLSLVARMGLEGHDNYDTYKDNVRFFMQEATENITFTRWKLLLKSERNTIQEKLATAKKSRDKLAKSLSKLQSASRTAVGIANAAVKMTPEAPKEAVEEYRKLEEDVDIEVSGLGKLDADLDQLGRQWESVEDNCRVALALDARTVADVASINGSESSVAGAPPEDEQFKLLTESRTTKVFATSKARDGFEYCAWKFTFAEPRMDPDPRPKEETLAQKRFREFAEKSNAGAGEITEVSMNKWLDIVEDFVQSRVPPLMDEEKGEIKVALIDDGVDVRRFRGPLVNRVGWPLLNATSRNDNWYKSTNEHGTHMAEMIVKVCPRVELYVAKLADWEQEQRLDMLREPSTAESAAKAVRWAISKGVEIISMSWCLIETPWNRDGIMELESVIATAAAEGILMFCTAADKSRYDEGLHLYPKTADTRRLMVVGSAMENGEKSDFVDEDQVNVLFPGEGIKELGDLKGSSAATALASGLAALILWCYKHEEGDIGAISKAENMFKVFERLKTSSNKWVNITRLLKVDGEIGDTASVVGYCAAALK